MRAIKVQVRVGEKEELWLLPLARLVAAQWEKWRGERALLHLRFDGLTLWAEDPDGALLEEVSRALEVPSGAYAVGGLWEYEWVG